MLVICRLGRSISCGVTSAEKPSFQAPWQVSCVHFLNNILLFAFSRFSLLHKLQCYQNCTGLLLAQYCVLRPKLWWRAARLCCRHSVRADATPSSSSSGVTMGSSQGKPVLRPEDVAVLSASSGMDEPQVGCQHSVSIQFTLQSFLLARSAQHSITLLLSILKGR